MEAWIAWCGRAAWDVTTKSAIGLDYVSNSMIVVQLLCGGLGSARMAFTIYFGNNTDLHERVEAGFAHRGV